jgi:hypothetical protein
MNCAWMLSPVMLCAEAEKEKALKKRVRSRKDVFRWRKQFIADNFNVNV